MSYGMEGYALFNFQSSFGTSQVTSLQAAPIISTGLAHGIEQMLETGMYNRYGEAPRHEGAHTVGGDIVMEGHPIGIGHLLKAACGQVTTATSTSGRNLHTFVPRTADFDDRAAGAPLTIEVFHGVGSAVLYHSLVGNNLSLEIANKALLKATVGFVGAGFERVAKATPVFPAGLPYIWDQASISYNAAAIFEARAMTIGLNNNLEAQYTLTSSKWPYRVKRTAPYQVTIGGTLQFLSHSYWLAFEAQSEVALTVNLAGQQTPNELKIMIPKFRLTEYAPVLKGPGVVEVEFNAIGAYDTTSSTALLIQLANSQSYY